jgi:formylglycine-generating enzyme required for sulfatase activity
MKRPFAIIIFGILGFVISGAATQCFAEANAILESSCVLPLSPSDRLIAIIKELYDAQVLTVDDLKAMRRSSNPLAHRRNSQSVLLAPTVAFVVTELQSGNPILQERFDGFIRSVEKQSSDQTGIRDVTKASYVQTTFNNIRGGRFLMGYNPSKATPDNSDRRQEDLNRAHEVEISNFRMADTPVTQWQYAMVMKSNPSRFKNGPASVFVTINGSPIQMRPNNPVESVLRTEENEFLRRLNEWSAKDDPRVYQVIANHRPFAHIRRPTEAEWEFVARNRGAWAGGSPDGVDRKNIYKYAWLGKNSSESTHPVGELQPLVIDGDKLFYDLFGNVFERVEDNYKDNYGLSDDQLLQLTKNPLVLFDRDAYTVMRGGSFNQSGFSLLSFRLSDDPPNSRHWDVGFRLAEDQ